jgi:hypothetical protein
MDDGIKNGRDKGLDGDLLVSVRIDHNALYKPREASGGRRARI